MTAPRRVLSRRKQVAIFLCLIALITVGCEGGDIALAKDFVQQWALDHAVEIAKEKAGIGSNDNLVTAAVGGYEAVKEIHEADDLMDQGRANEDPKKMDEAIKLRPNDWTYQLSRADLALRMGDVTTYNRYWQASSPPHIDLYAKWEQQQADELASVDASLSLGRGLGFVGGFATFNQCAALYDRLAFLAGLGIKPAAETQSAGAIQLYYQQRRQDCEQLPH